MVANFDKDDDAVDIDNEDGRAKFVTAKFAIAKLAIAKKFANIAKFMIAAQNDIVAQFLIVSS